MKDKLFTKISDYVSKYLSTRVIFAMDMCLSLAASVIVVLLSGSATYPGNNPAAFWTICLLSSAVFSAVLFYLIRSAHLIIRYTTFRSILKFGIAAAGKAVMMWATLVIFCFFTKLVSYSSGFVTLMFLDFFITFFLLVSVRLVMIVVYDFCIGKISESLDKKRVLIYGTSDKSIAVVRRLEMSTHYKVIGFISPDKDLKDFRIAGLPIYYFDGEEGLKTLKSRVLFSSILFSRDSDVQAESHNLIKFASSQGIGILVVPSIDTVDENRPLPVREVKIEDLLGRPEIKISLKEIRDNFRGKTVMVTGAAGSIGSELCRQIAAFGVDKIIFFDNGETPMHNLRLDMDERFPEVSYVPVIGDVRLLQRLDFAFRTYRPQIVFHAAAYKHVPLMEENPCEAVLVNVAGSRNVADKCLEYGVEKMVMISTDKAVNPTNIMGCTKRLAEIYVQSLGLAVESGRIAGKTKFVTTRFGNVLGSNGSVIPRFREQLAKGGPLTVTHPDITRFFMTIPEACRLVMEAATLPVENRICVFDMGEPVKIDALARKMIELSGYKPDVDVKIVYTGLRPGEKLYEEVLSNVENTEPTSHDRIRIAKVRAYEYADAKDSADELERLSRLVDIPSTVKLMKSIVPEYVSNNSKYSEYDKH